LCHEQEKETRRECRVHCRWRRYEKTTVHKLSKDNHEISVRPDLELLIEEKYIVFLWRTRGTKVKMGSTVHVYFVRNSETSFERL
jgi:hypothetical protein